MAHIGFGNLVSKLKSQGHSEGSASAIAAAIGRRKYGKKRFDAAAQEHKPLGKAIDAEPVAVMILVKAIDTHAKGNLSMDFDAPSESSLKDRVLDHIRKNPNADLHAIGRAVGHNVMGSHGDYKSPLNRALQDLHGSGHITADSSSFGISPRFKALK